jgi:hypothetical protein
VPSELFSDLTNALAKLERPKQTGQELELPGMITHYDTTFDNFIAQMQSYGITID